MPRVAPVEKPSRSKLGAVYYYATPLDIALIIIGCIGKFGFGIVQGVVLIVFGEFFEILPEEFESMGRSLFLQMLLFGGISGVSEAIGTSCLELSKNRQIAKWRTGYIKAVLRQNVGWYDVNRPQELSTRMGESIVLIDKGLNQGCLGLIAASLGQAISGLVIGLWYKWDVALITLAVALLSYLPAFMYLTKALDKRTKTLSDAYAAAGGVASETLSGLRTVASLGLEQSVLSRYGACLEVSQRAVKGSSKKIGLALAILNASMFWVLAAASLYSTFLMHDEYISTEFEYTFDGRSYCAHPCDAYDPVQVDLDTLETGGDGCALRTVTNAAFMMTCASGERIGKEPQREPTVLANFTVGYDAAWPGTRDDAFDDAFDAAGSSRPCSLNIGILYIAVQAVFQAVFTSAQLTGPAQTFLKASRACTDVLMIIARTPPIDSFSDEGAKPAGVRGEVRLTDVVFAYPSAPDFRVCNGYSLHIPAGSSCALVGPSGSGKSTIVARTAWPKGRLWRARARQSRLLTWPSLALGCSTLSGGATQPLSVPSEAKGPSPGRPNVAHFTAFGHQALLERFYDPAEGRIFLDGADIQTLNVKWLRRQLGLVSQEPLLFLGSVADQVAENIQLGKPGASQQEIEAAAAAANAHEFVSKTLAEGYATPVGLGGGKLSGGQKQRIAIARAIIKQPSVMILDEATSALDNASERVVQAALDDVMRRGQYTSITIAHRLSTIMHSQKIAVVQKGRIVEEGTYDELLQIGEGGLFHQLAAKLHGDRQTDRASMENSMVAEGEAAAGTDGAARASGVDAQLMVVQGELVQGGGDTSGAAAAGGKGAGEEGAGGKGKKKGGGKGGKGEETKEEKPKEPDPMGRLFAYRTPGDGKYYGVGIFSGGMTGVGKGFFGLLMMRSITALAPANPQTLLEEGLTWSGAFLATGLLSGIFELVALNSLFVVGENLTKNIRLALMEKLLHFELGYFDHEENSMGALTEFLGSKVTLLQGLVGEKLGMISQSVVMLVAQHVATVVTMFIWGDWRVALVVLGCFPISGALMGIAMATMMPMDQGKQGKEDKDAKQIKSAGTLVGEVVLGIRTVASFSAEQQFYDDYAAQVAVIQKKGVPRAIAGGTLNGVAMGGMYVIFGVQLWYGLWLAAGGHLVDLSYREDASGCVLNDTNGFMDKIMVPVMAMMMVMMMMASMAMMATDATAAADAAKKLFERFDRPSLCDPFSPDGETLPAVSGAVQLVDVVFCYPTAPHFKVCNGYSLKVQPGQVCALCGPSGSGKSTIIALLQRFYDPKSGSVLLDGVDLKTLNVKWLRAQLGMVGQEPVLFEGTVAQNIAHGKEGATQAEIEEAASLANAHAFITSDLGDGYSTQVGLRGGKLSGGQKQRVAIARALVRRPSILLLDEATSALDNESEKVVQAALDELMSKQKRTTLTIAHRLSTIRGADTIAVVSAGQVVEQGTHDELLRIGPKGVYFQLVEAQQ